MKQFLLNLWNAQRNAASLCALESRHEWLVAEHRKVEANLDEMKEEVDSIIELAITLSVEYRAAIGNPVDVVSIPVSIQEAHALRGRHTKWHFKADRDFGTRFSGRPSRMRALRWRN